MMYEFADHFFKGFFINKGLQGEDLVIDSKLIHYLRLSILIVTAFVVFMVIFLLVMVFLTIKSSHTFSNHEDKINRLRKIPYS